MDVNLRVDRDVFVRSREANIEVYSDGDLGVHVNRAKQTLVLDGVLLSERGEYTFMTRRFTIKRGSATFINSTELNPTLQATGEYLVRQPNREAINIQIVVGGTLRSPNISLTSDAQPPIPQSDLLSYLAFGQSSSSLVQLEGSGLTNGSGGSNVVGAGAALASKQLAGIAIGVLADQVAGSAAQSLGADVFTITPADVQTDVGNFLRATQFEFGKYIKSHTFVAVKSPLDPKALQRPGVQMVHRFGGLRGYRLETGVDTRYLLREPTLQRDQNIRDDQRVRGIPDSRVAVLALDNQRAVTLCVAATLTRSRSRPPMCRHRPRASALMRIRSTSTIGTTSSNTTKAFRIAPAPIRSSWCSAGEYYLFETIGEGYWHSRDLGTWEHITPSRWPLTDLVAPAVLSVRDTIYLLPSTTRPLPILMLTQPATGRVEFYNRLLPWLPMARDHEAVDACAKPDSVQPGPWDPQFFHDPDTERWFMYWNSSNVYPLHVIELDKIASSSRTRGRRAGCSVSSPMKHGWERFGQDHRDTTITPFIEGAWMTKHGGTYYLQYGAPGTEYNVYATGIYVGDNPLGPFTYAPYNPVAYKPGGFVQGAGHGNTFQDVHGNWWNTGTPWIAVNWNFERRIGLHPGGLRRRRRRCTSTRASATSRTGCRRRRGARATTFSPDGCCCRIGRQ